MKISVIFVSLMVVTSGGPFELIDYSNEPYVLIPIGYSFMYRENETLFHIFNITKFEEKFNKYNAVIRRNNNVKLMLLRNRCRGYLDQLIKHRYRRGLDFLGTGIKFITGTLDHNDMILVHQKLNALIENNNKLAVVNSQLQRQLRRFTGNLSEERTELLFEWLASELLQVIHTINLAKAGILNTAVLNMEEIREVMKKDGAQGAPLLEILEHSTLKILEIRSVYVLLIRYPKTEQKCMLYAIGRGSGEIAFGAICCVLSWYICERDRLQEIY